MKWIAEAVPRANFGKDLLLTFGASMTICRVQRNNAEQRIAAMRANAWKPETIAAATKATMLVTDEADEEAKNLGSGSDWKNIYRAAARPFMSTSMERDS